LTSMTGIDPPCTPARASLDCISEFAAGSCSMSFSMTGTLWLFKYATASWHAPHHDAPYTMTVNFAGRAADPLSPGGSSGLPEGAGFCKSLSALGDDGVPLAPRHRGDDVRTIRVLRVQVRDVERRSGALLARRHDHAHLRAPLGRDVGRLVCDVRVAPVIEPGEEQIGSVVGERQRGERLVLLVIAFGGQLVDGRPALASGGHHRRAKREEHPPESSRSPRGLLHAPPPSALPFASSSFSAVHSDIIDSIRRLRACSSRARFAIFSQLPPGSSFKASRRAPT